MNTSFTRRTVLTGSMGLAAGLILLPASALAAYPDHTIHLVVPFAPGGGTDLVARALGHGISIALKATVIIDNKPGGGTILGSDVVAKSAADGYTVLVATMAHAVNPSLHTKLPFVTEKAFDPVILVASSHNILVVKADSPFKSVQDVINAAKKDPGKLTYASQGPGTSAHLAGELFKNLAKVDITHVPYRGAGPALTDLLGGHVDMMFATNAAVASLVSSGQLRALGISAPAGHSPVDNLPTIADAGLPGYVVDSWYGLYVPAGTPKEAVDRLNDAVKVAVKDPDFVRLANSEGLVIRAGAPQEMRDFERAEAARWSKIVHENNISAD